MLNPDELSRYSRHILLPELGLAGQEKLKNSKVLVLGAGGLSCPALLYLTAAGVGTIGIVDFDTVESSNLQRQVLYNVSDIGTPKVEAARKHLLALNPHLEINTYAIKIDSTNAMDIIGAYDVIIDGTDSFSTRYLANDACVLLNKPLVYGAIYRFNGQVSVFNYTKTNGSKGPNYRDLYPTPPAPGEVPDCSEAGVLGVLPGIIGTMQATEAIKIITGIGEPLSGKLWLYDALTAAVNIIEIQADSTNPISGTNPSITKLINYDEFCNFIPSTINSNITMIKEITPAELKQKMDNKEDFQLIDVREEYEYDTCNLGGELIPLGTIINETERISKEKPVVVHCRSGKRSATAILELQNRHGYTNLINLKGGILAWIDEIDPSMPKS